MLLTITLGIMGMLTLFSIVAGADWAQMSSNLGSENSLLLDYSFNIDQTIGAISILIVIMSIVILIGIRIWNTGLSESSIRTITIITMYAGLWALLSTFAHPLILEIEIFGTLIYIILTLLYVVAIFQKISEAK